MHRKLLLCGIVIWLAATAGLRLAGQHVLPPRNAVSTLLLFAASFPGAAWIARFLCRRFQLPREQWPAGAISLLLPTLVFDPFSSAFFDVVFPNMDPRAAGVFGGWMLWCCAGALAGVTLRWPKTQ
jgi:hypothetical protein